MEATKAYRIADFVTKFEVTMKGRAVDPYDKPLAMNQRRKSPLDYIRLRNHGHVLTTLDRRIAEKAWRPGEITELAIHGLYFKLLLLAADQPREFRGWILDEQQKPLDVRGIAETLGVQDISRLRGAIGVLTDPDIGLLEVCEFSQSQNPQCEDGQTSGSFRKFPEISGLFIKAPENPGDFRTKTKLSKENTSIREIPDSASDFSCANSASASDQQITKAKNTAALKICELITPRSQADRTTYQHIFRQLEEQVKNGVAGLDIFNQLTEKAQQCLSAQKPIALFIETAKQTPFNYVPERRRLIPQT